MFLGSKTFSGAIKSIYFTIVDLTRYSDSGIPNKNKNTKFAISNLLLRILNLKFQVSKLESQI